MSLYPAWGTQSALDFNQPSSSLLDTKTGPTRNVPEKTNDSPPPIPQRINQPSFSSLSPNGMYGSYYGGNPYQNYMYGNTGGMYSNFGSPTFQNNTMLNGLENASQNAFQSAQAFIGAFSSVSMMLESTLFAVQNSVRAIAGVADQFGNLRNYILSSTAAFYRLVRYYYKKLMCLFKLQQPEVREERFWQDAVSGRTSREESKIYASLLFFSLVIATPWFIWKLSKSINSEQQNEKKWFEGSGEHFVAEVKFPFVARNQDELSLSKNTIIRLAPKHRQPNIRGWLLASDGDKQGLIPANYIKVLGKNRKESEDSTQKENSQNDFEKIYEKEIDKNTND